MFLVGHKWALFLDLHSNCISLSVLVVFWLLSCNWIFNLCQKRKEKHRHQHCCIARKAHVKKRLKFVIIGVSLGGET